jgi:hypothetical protein
MTTWEKWAVPISLFAGFWAINYICIDMGLKAEGIMPSAVLIFSSGTLGFNSENIILRNNHGWAGGSVGA